MLPVVDGPAADMQRPGAIPAASGDPGQDSTTPAGGAPAPPSVPVAGAGGTIDGAAGLSAPKQQQQNDEDCGPAAVPMEVDGKLYSPGGSVLPHPCMPFHATTNNPYALLCTEFLPDYGSPFPGDQYCILPPPPDKGIQFGAHPQGDDYWQQMWAGDMSGYDDLDPQWVLPPGDETYQNYYASTGNAQSRTYYRTNMRMRSGSHHLVLFGTSTSTRGWTGGRTNAGFLPPSPNGAFYGFSERPDDGRPVATLERPPEDENIGYSLPGDQAVQFGMHHFNASDRPILREAWVNLWYMSEEEATRVARPLWGTSLVDVVPPRSESVFHRKMVPTMAGTRLMTALGHRHAWTPRFHVWVERASGESQLILDSWDWWDEKTYAYDSVSQNPGFDVDARTDGAYSGVVTLDPGDVLHYACHRDTTDARAAELGVPAPTQTLRFGNEAYNAEMCEIIGEVVDGNLVDDGWADESEMKLFTGFKTETN